MGKLIVKEKEIAVPGETFFISRPYFSAFIKQFLIIKYFVVFIIFIAISLDVVIL